MKKFCKIFFIIILVLIVIAAGVLIYFTFKGSGGRDKALAFLKETSKQQNELLDGYVCEMDYLLDEYGITDDTYKKYKNSKIFIAYEGNKKKVAVVNFDKYDKFESMQYFEFELLSNQKVKIITYEQNDGENTNYIPRCEGSEQTVSYDEAYASMSSYEKCFHMHPEIVIMRCYEQIFNYHFDSRNFGPLTKEDGFDLDYNVSLSKNVFVNTSTIKVTAKHSSPFSLEHEDKIKIKDGFLIELDKKEVFDIGTATYDGTENVTYKYYKGTINAETIYNTYN